MANIKLDKEQFLKGVEQFYEKMLMQDKAVENLEKSLNEARQQNEKIESHKFGFLVAYGLAVAVDTIHQKYPEIAKEIDKEVEALLQK